MYLTPSFSSSSSLPDPYKAVYKSPWPGGHHSRWVFCAHSTGPMVALSTLGTLFCMSSILGSCTRAGYLAKKDSVSSEVLKLFISMKVTLLLNCLRMEMTCLAVRSRKVLPPFTSSRDLALSRPIDVPRPPFSLSTTVCCNREASTATLLRMSVSRWGREATGVMSASRIMPEAPFTRSRYECAKAAIAASDSFSNLILARNGAKRGSEVAIARESDG
mmetsp:Transcript_16671/g.36986  ORF Transcript_16671/g.36986 Transcript_16671/m.36986 type:complete len:218 (+) Transcript_16671:4170-4823(+)